MPTNSRSMRIQLATQISAMSPEAADAVAAIRGPKGEVGSFLQLMALAYSHGAKAAAEMPSSTASN